MTPFTRILYALHMAGVTTAVALFIAPTGPAGIKAHPGAPAPAFSAKDISGQTVSLANYRGKTIIPKMQLYQ
jgi:hypothetical protein